MPSITSLGRDLSSQGLEALGFDTGHRRDTSLFPPPLSPTQFPDLSWDQEKIERVSVDSLIAGTITSQSITLAVLGGYGDVKLQAGKTDFSDTTSGFILGMDDSDNDEPKLNIGNASSYMDWNVTTADTLTISGTLVASTIVGGSIHIPDQDTTANSFHTNTTGTSWWGATETSFTADNNNANAWINADGSARFASVTITGGNLAGLTISSTDLTATSGGNTTIVSSGSTAFTSGPTASPTFTVTQAGLLTSTSALIAGWDIDATTISSTGVTMTSGAGASLAFGATPPTGVSTGTGVYMDATGIYGLSANTQNFIISATDGSITSILGTVGGWSVVSGYIYNLQSGTPTATPNDGVVLDSGNEALIIYEDTAERVRVGYLSAGVYGLKVWDTTGAVVIAEISDTQQLLSGLTLTNEALYVLASGTPTSSPTDGLAIVSGSTPYVASYEDSAERTRMGYLSAGVFGFLGYATDGTTKVFELSDTQQMIAGWTFTDTSLYNLASGTPTSVPNDGLVFTANATPAVIAYENTEKRVELGYLSAGVFGFKGYADNGTTVIFEMSDTQKMIAGWTFTDLSLYNLASGTPTSSPNDGLVLTANSTPAIIAYEDTAKRAELGYLSAGVFGIKAYATDGTTVIFEASDTQQMIGGFFFTDTTLASNATAANANVLIDAGNSLLRLGPTSGDTITLDGANQRLSSSNYVSGALGAGFLLESNLLEVGNASIRGKLQMATFVANSISAVNGDLAVVVGSDVLSVDMTALDASTVTIDGDMTLAVGDIIRIKEGVDDEWMTVTVDNGGNNYTVTRDSASVYTANNNPVWTKGATVVNFGASGQGGMFLTANDTNAPFLSVFTHAGSPWSTMTTRVRVGNLNGYLGYASDIFGLGVGSSSAGEANVTIEPTNGFRVRSGTTTLMQVDNAGTATIGSFTLAATTISATNLVLTSGAANVANISVGTGSNLGGLNSGNGATDIAFWAGDTFANRATAPFRVQMNGDATVGTLTITSLETGSLSIGGVTVTSSAAELNILDGVTATFTELNYLDIASLGTGAASKAVVLDAGDDYIWPATGLLTYGGTQITASGAELNTMDGITASTAELNIMDGVTATFTELNYLDITSLGTGAASKAVVLDSGDDYIWPATGLLTYGGTAITASGAEINVLDGYTGDVNDLNEMEVFFGSTDISGAEAETLTNGSNADTLHTHDSFETLEATNAGDYTLVPLYFRGVENSGMSQGGWRFTHGGTFPIQILTGSISHLLTTATQVSDGGGITAQVTSTSGTASNAPALFEMNVSDRQKWMWSVYLSNDSSYDLWFGFTSDSANANAPVAGDEYAAFHMDDGTLKCESSDGVAIETTTPITVTLGRINGYVIFRDSSSVKFYLNNVLVATHSTRVPTSQDCFGFFYGAGNTTGSNSGYVILDNVTLAIHNTDYVPTAY